MGEFIIAGRKNNIVRARVTVRGTRPLLQHAFGPESIALEKAEREGVAGNDPSEWRRSCLLTEEGQLYILPSYVFGCLRDAAKHTKKGRGSLQPLVAATLQIEESIILLNRHLPPGTEPQRNPMLPVYLDVCGVKNPATKSRNVRYRLAAGPGWECCFTLRWDKTIVSRQQMQAILLDASTLIGLADGRAVGNGRFDITDYTELTGGQDDAEEAPTEGSVADEPPADRVGKGRKKVPALSGTTEVDGSAR